MILNIDPTYDCVFKALFACEENKDLLIHFLNAVMRLPAGRQITDVQILSPFNEKDFQADKLTVLDLKAVDDDGTIYQVELQRRLHGAMDKRIAYGWGKGIVRQLLEGDGYKGIKPVVCIWLLGESLFPQLPGWLHQLKLSDAETGAILFETSSVCLMELPKVAANGPVRSEGQRWQRFFVEGKGVDTSNPPDFMKTLEMEKAMAVLKSFIERGERALCYDQEEKNMRYRNTLRDDREELEQKVAEAARSAEAAIKRAEVAQSEAEAARSETEAARSEAEAARSETESARSEVEVVKAEREALLAKLISLGVNPEEF